MRELAHAALNRREVASELMDRMAGGAEGQGTLEVPLPNGVFILDSNGKPREVLKLSVSFKARRATGPVELSHKLWEDTPVAYGEGITGFGKTYVTIAEPAPDVLRGSFTFMDPNTGEERTLHFGQAASEGPLTSLESERGG